MIYCDYNSTAPLSPSVIEGLSLLKGHPLYNSSSPHALGKASLKHVHGVEQFLLETFQLKSTHQVLFHSGATEGLHTFLWGRARYLKSQNKKLLFLYSPLDHSAAKGVVEILTFEFQDTVTVMAMKIDALTGRIDHGHLQTQLALLGNSHDEILMNITWGSGESGVVEDINLLAAYKQRYSHLHLHVDGTQVPGKYLQSFQLLDSVDAYSFSGHKFGAFKGIGFSFFRSEFRFTPLFQGGEQQKGHRSGTVPVELILSLQWALQNLPALNWKLAYENLANLELKIETLLGDQGQILLPYSKLGSAKLVNTIFLVLYALPADQFLPILEMQGIAASAGPACKSMSLQASALPAVLGLEKWGRHTLRLSLCPAQMNTTFINDLSARFQKFLSILPRV